MHVGRGTHGWINGRGWSVIPLLIWAMVTPVRAERTGDTPPVNIFPQLDARHRHVRELLANTLNYFQPEQGMIDPVSGYPREGWNQEPERGLYLRDFTQLTAIGLWLEILAAHVHGDIVDAYWTPDRALDALVLAQTSLKHDQADARLADRGLLGNFLALGPEGRSGPMASEVHRRDLEHAFGVDRAGAIWSALAAKGWIQPMRDQQMAVIRRPPGYGLGGFDGPLSPFADLDTRAAILGVLDRRVAQVVFGDNANLASSVAKVIGALETSEHRSDARVGRIVSGLEAFLERQRGYAYLYDAEQRLFRFGWNATLGHFLGWPDGAGYWRIAYSDYLVNEFRGPTLFVVARYGMPPEAFGQLGFQMRYARGSGAASVATLAPFDGSAFQSFGLSLCMGERSHPAWHTLLDRSADLHLAYARRHRLPGLLSESYSGRDTEYTARCGVPDLAVASEGRITHAPSLYTLGLAYALRPDEVDTLLAEQAPVIRSLMTPHGPWEGYDMRARAPIRFQTTAHTAALLLGALDVDQRNMEAYLNARGYTAAVRELFAVGAPFNLLGSRARASFSSPHGQDMRGGFEGTGYRIRGTRTGPARLTLTYPSQERGVRASGLDLHLTYRLHGPVRQGRIRLLRADASQRAFPVELMLRFEETLSAPGELHFPLPATPGLQGLTALELDLDAAGPGLLDFTIESLELRNPTSDR